MVLSTTSLSKNYGKTRALREVDLSVPKGSVFGILGPNGSGKTTLLGTVLSILRPSSGSFQWFEQKETSGADLRKRIGTLLETPNFYPYLNGPKNLAITASIRKCGQDCIDKVLEQVGLSEHKKLKFQEYSLGMKQRLALGSCLLGDPEVLVLDEPTNGLDPTGIADVRTLIKEISESGKTIILASHLLDEVEKVCSHVAILKKGQLLASGPMDELLQGDKVIEVQASDMKALKEALQAHEPSLTLIEHGECLQVSGKNLQPSELNRYCFDQGISLSLVCQQKRDLEGRFLEITDD